MMSGQGRYTLAFISYIGEKSVLYILKTFFWLWTETTYYLFLSHQDIFVDILSAGTRGNTHLFVVFLLPALANLVIAERFQQGGCRPDIIFGHGHAFCHVKAILGLNVTTFAMHYLNIYLELAYYITQETK